MYTETSEAAPQFFPENTTTKGEKSTHLYIMLMASLIICQSLGQAIAQFEQEGE